MVGGRCHWDGDEIVYLISGLHRVLKFTFNRQNKLQQEDML